MAITLTTPITNANTTRLIIQDVHAFDNTSTMTVTLELRTTAGTDNIVSSRTVVIRNGTSDRVSKGTLSANMRLDEQLLYEPNAVATATGYTDAINAWRGQTTAAARKTALEAQMLTAGTIHSSLTGT
jgi:hypothetical protein